MPLTKKDLIETIRSKDNLTKKQAFDLVETIIGTFASTLASGEEVLIRGLGEFRVEEKVEPKSIDPTTKKDRMQPAKKAVTFCCSRKLQDEINGS
jgi:integration host factor subunit alpha